MCHERTVLRLSLFLSFSLSLSLSLFLTEQVVGPVGRPEKYRLLICSGHVVTAFVISRGGPGLDPPARLPPSPNNIKPFFILMMRSQQNAIRFVANRAHAHTSSSTVHRFLALLSSQFTSPISFFLLFFFPLPTLMYLYIAPRHYPTQYDALEARC